MHANSSIRQRFVHRVALGAVVAGALLVAVVAGERPAAAQVVYVAPPVPRIEVIPVVPAPHLFWVDGYWGWYGGRHVWIGGRWERERPGWVYAHPHWAHEGHGWRFGPGRWHHR